MHSILVYPQTSESRVIIPANVACLSLPGIIIAATSRTREVLRIPHYGVSLVNLTYTPSVLETNRVAIASWAASRGRGQVGEPKYPHTWTGVRIVGPIDVDAVRHIGSRIGNREFCICIENF